MREATRFWAKVHVGKPDECWEWTAYRDRDGYGRFHHGKHCLQAHRVLFGWMAGERPEVVRHRCDNRACCNPWHLEAGTQLENIADRQARGRQATGERNRGGRRSANRLTQPQVEQIRELLTQGLSCREIGKRFGVSHGPISQIKRGTGWKQPA